MRVIGRCVFSFLAQRNKNRKQCRNVHRIFTRKYSHCNELQERKSYDLDSKRLRTRDYHRITNGDNGVTLLARREMAGRFLSARYVIRISRVCEVGLEFAAWDSAFSSPEPKAHKVSL